MKPITALVGLMLVAQAGQRPPAPPTPQAGHAGAAFHQSF